MAWMQISTELTITLTSYLPRTLVVTSQTAFIVIILVMKLQRTVSQFMWERLASLSWGTFASLRTRSYQFLNVARSNGLICIIIFDWMFLLHVSMHQEQGLFTTNLSWGLLGLVRLIKICKKLNTWSLSIQAKLSKIWKQRQIVQKSLQKFRKLLNFRNVNHSIENSKKNPRAKLNGKNTSGKKNRKLGYTSRGCPLFWKFWKPLFHSLQEATENSNRRFWVNGNKAPKVFG